MTFKRLKRRYQKLIIFVCVCTLPFAAHSGTEEIIGEKRTEVAMRMIGHEVLKCLGDVESRVMPIEKIDEHYKIAFEFEFGFDPSDIIFIVDGVMAKMGIANYYLVEVEQCETKAVVHSFEGGRALNSSLVPCGGRLLPEDCYSLLVTILEGVNPAENLLATTSSNPSFLSEELSSDGTSLTSSTAQHANPFKLVFVIVPLLILLGIMAYVVRKKKFTAIDPNLLLIGAFQFDKKNRILSFEDKRTELSYKEAELLSLLHSSANIPLEREVILQRVWGDEGAYVGRTLDVFISKLRKKLASDASVKIVNIRGIGYKLVTDLPATN